MSPFAFPCPLSFLFIPGSGTTAGRSMTFDYACGIALAVLLTVYLVYALLRPERF